MSRNGFGNVCGIALLALLICASPARSQQNSALLSENNSETPRTDSVSVASIAETNAPPADPAATPPDPIQPGKSATTDGAPSMKWFHSKGVEFHAILKAEGSSNFRSGFSGDGTDFRSLVETSMGIDMQKAISWPGAQVQASFHDYFGSNATEQLMGDAQGFSNIDSYPMNRIYELWFQQFLAQSKLRIKLGRIDANTEFAYVENATDFLNSSMGFSPTILDMHTYPNPRLGAVAAFAPGKFLSISAAIFQCQPSGSMVLTEAVARWKISSRASPGRLALGFWIHPHMQDGLYGTQASGVHGYYAVLEQTLWKRGSEVDDDSRGIRAFAQWGDTNPLFNGIAHHLGMGFEWTGAFSQRPADVVGLGITTISLGQDYYGDVSAGRERSIETFYKVPVRTWLSFTPDFQWIVNPSGSLERPRTLAGTMRMVISF